MRLASWNLWDDARGRAERPALAAAELARLQPDLLCVQEAPSAARCRSLAAACGCGACFRRDGLAILTRLPVLAERFADGALTVTVATPGGSLEVGCVHLPWDSVLARERGIAALTCRRSDADFTALCGDFNAGDGSSVHDFALGRRSLDGAEARPVWNDLALEWAERGGGTPEPTLATGTNPRWRGQGYRPGAGVRMDWLLLRETYPRPAPALRGFFLFGTAADPVSGWCPSDHYGVCAELDFGALAETK